MTDIIYDIETTGFNYEKDRITAIGLISTVNEKPIVVMDEDEHHLLTEFWEIMRNVSPHHLIGYNNHQFDDPFIFQRSLLLGIPGTFKLFDYDNSIDLRSLLTSNRKKVYGKNFKSGTLEDYAQKYGIEMGKHGGGKDCVIAWEAKDYDFIKKHCESDILITYELYKKIRGFI